MNKIFVYLPCYNEEKNIADLMDGWLNQEEKLKSSYGLVIKPIDDKSTDKTLSIIKKYGEKYINIKPIVHEVNKNLAGGLMTAVNDFLDSAEQGDKMVIMDGDNTQKPSYIHAMLSKLTAEQACIIASRYQKGAEVKGLSKIREIYSELARIYYTLVLRIPGVKDYTCGYRLYTYHAIFKANEKFGDKLIEIKSFACMMELLYKVYLAGAVFDEVPFTLRYDDKQGDSKMNIFNTIRDSIFSTISLKFKNRKN